MRTIITVTRHPTLQGVYQCAAQGGGARPGKKNVDGASAAAAQAMQAAISYGSGGYCIFAPKSVLDFIPTDMRSKGETK